MMDKNIDIGSIASQCGTSIQVIQSNYSQQRQMVVSWNKSVGQIVQG